MTAQQKMACAELLISLVALIAVVAAYPWLGERAMGMFGCLGLLGLTPLFLMRRKKDSVVTDERDQEIAMRATFFGMGAAWMFMFVALLVLTLAVEFEQPAVPNGVLSLVLWVQFALCYLVKGASSLYMYGGRQHAA